MNRILKLAFALMLMMIPIIGTGLSPSVSAADPYCLDENMSAFLTLINDHRAANGLPPLTASTTLGTAAQLHSEDMATQDYSSHTGLDGSTPESRMAAAGYDLAKANYTGENIYYGTAGLDTPQAAFDWWKNSPGHNANMLSPNFTAIGIGVATNPATGKTHWTNTFGGFVDTTAQPCAPANNGGGGDNNGNMGGGGTTKPKQGSLTITVKQCPPEAVPEIGDFTHCKDVEDPDGLLTNLDADESIEFDSAPIRPELTFNYEWNDLPEGNYTVKPSLEGFLWILVSVGLDGEQEHKDSFEIVKGEHIYVSVYVWSDDTDMGTPVVTDDDTTDTDGDGLYEVDETDYYQTDPEEADTDGDGVSDGDKVYYGSDPLDSDSYPDDSSQSDSDGDGLYDVDESDVYGTEPDNADSDEDGVDDGEEVFNGTDPLDPDSN